MHFKRSTPRDPKSTSEWGTPKNLQKNKERGLNRGNLKRHGKICSKTGKPHQFEHTENRKWAFLSAESIHYKCKDCGKQDIDFNWPPKGIVEPKV